MPFSVGGLLVESLARRDFEAVGDCLDRSVRLRALLPFGPVELRGREGVEDWFRELFTTSGGFELLDATVGEVGARLYLRWRVRLQPGQDQPLSLIEQHVFATATERIEALDMLCSGFVPELAPTCRR